MVRSRLFRPVLCAGLLVVVACADSSNPAEPEGGMLASRGQGGQPADLPSADELARQVPGFGGFYLDATGTPTVHLTRGSDRGNAERALAGYLAAQGLGPAALQVQEGRYGWQQLERWQEAATIAAFEAAATAVFVDNDETVNRIVIGVEDLNGMGQVRAAIARSGLPDEAVIIQRAEPIALVATLQNVATRPVQAGVQINFPGYVCSVGFNATSGGQNSMITASHCTNTQGGVEDTPYWQPLQSSQPTQVAREVDDPVYLKNGPGCPKGRSCRRSDAARALYINGVSGAVGTIAKTTALGSLEVNGTFTITSDDTDNSTPAGATVNKVGRTTGWTAGTMTNTCVNTGVQGSRIVQLCQNFVTAGVAGGDSGSDVFLIISGTNVRLLGVLWGGGGGQFVFSPLQNVIQELGPLTTH